MPCHPRVFTVTLPALLLAWLLLTLALLAHWQHTNTPHESPDDDYSAAVLRVEPSPSATPSPSASVAPTRCATTRVGAHFVTDSLGRTCRPRVLDAASGCCPAAAEQWSCAGCADACCAAFERCVGCCMAPTAAPQQRARSFVVCSARCRTSAESLDEHGRYKRDDARYCYDSPPSASAEPSARPDAPPPAKILDLRAR